MYKTKIKEHLAKRFLEESNIPGVSITNSVKAKSGKFNKAGVKDIEKNVGKFEKDFKEDPNANQMAVNEFNYEDDFQKTFHDEMEILNGQEMIQYDSKPDDIYSERALEAIKGSSRMGNNPEWANVIPKEKGFTGPQFGQQLVDRIKSSAKKRSEQTPTLNLRGHNIQADLKDTGHKPYSIEEGAKKPISDKKDNIKPQIKESMKRLIFKQKFNGLSNALKLIPESYKVENKVFEMTDGNETYKIRWENKPVVLIAADGTKINEDLDKMKHLFSYKSEDTLGLVKGNARLDENKAFSDIWGKTKVLLGESEDIESTTAPEGDLDDAVSPAKEAKSHIEGSTSTDKGTQAPTPKEDEWEDADISQAPEAKAHVHLKESEDEESEMEEEVYEMKEMNAEELMEALGLTEGFDDDEDEMDTADVDIEPEMGGDDDDEDEDDITIPMDLPKQNSSLKLLKSPSTGQYAILKDGKQLIVPAEFMDIASDTSMPSATRAARNYS